MLKSVVVFVACGAATAGILAAILPARPAPINIRWRPDVSASQRAALEQRFHLADGGSTEGTTWSYQLTDPSFLNIRAIVRDPSVDDTAHIHRRFFRPEFAFDRDARIAIGALLVGGVASLLLLVRSVAPASSVAVQVHERTLIRILGTAPLLVLAVSGVVLLLALVGYQPLWASREVTLVQAAQGGDSATVFRLLSAGSDPNAAGPVLFDRRKDSVMLTPLEAAVESRQVEVVQLLMKMGARTTEPDRARLACLADVVDAPEVAAYLKAAAPPAAPANCSSITLPAH